MRKHRLRILTAAPGPDRHPGRWRPGRVGVESLRRRARRADDAEMRAFRLIPDTRHTPDPLNTPATKPRRSRLVHGSAPTSGELTNPRREGIQRNILILMENLPARAAAREGFWHGTRPEKSVFRAGRTRVGGGSASRPARLYIAIHRCAIDIGNVFHSDETCCSENH